MQLARLQNAMSNKRRHAHRPDPAKPTHYDSDVTAYGLFLPLPPIPKNAPIFPPILPLLPRVFAFPNPPQCAGSPGHLFPPWTHGVDGGERERFRVTLAVPQPLIYRAREQRPPQITWKRGRYRSTSVQLMQFLWGLIFNACSILLFVCKKK